MTAADISLDNIRYEAHVYASSTEPLSKSGVLGSAEKVLHDATAVDNWRTVTQQKAPSPINETTCEEIRSSIGSRLIASQVHICSYLRRLAFQGRGHDPSFATGEHLLTQTLTASSTCKSWKTLRVATSVTLTPYLSRRGRLPIARPNQVPRGGSCIQRLCTISYQR